MGDLEGAVNDFIKAIKLDPEDSFSYKERGLAKIHLGQIKSGCKDFKKSEALGKILIKSIVIRFFKLFMQEIS